MLFLSLYLTTFAMKLNSTRAANYLQKSHTWWHQVHLWASQVSTWSDWCIHIFSERPPWLQHQHWPSNIMTSACKRWLYKVLNLGGWIVMQSTLKFSVIWLQDLKNSDAFEYSATLRGWCKRLPGPTYCRYFQNTCEKSDFDAFSSETFNVAPIEIYFVLLLEACFEKSTNSRNRFDFFT